MKILLRMVAAHEQFMDTLHDTCKALSTESSPPYMCTKPLRELSAGATLAFGTLYMLPNGNSMRGYFEKSFQAIGELGTQTSEFIEQCREEPVLSRLLHPWTNDMEELSAAIIEYLESPNSEFDSDAQIMRVALLMRPSQSFSIIPAGAAVLLAAFLIVLVIERLS